MSEPVLPIFCATGGGFRIKVDTHTFITASLITVLQSKQQFMYGIEARIETRDADTMREWMQEVFDRTKHFTRDEPFKRTLTIPVLNRRLVLQGVYPNSCEFNEAMNYSTFQRPLRCVAKLHVDTYIWEDA